MTEKNTTIIILKTFFRRITNRGTFLSFSQNGEDAVINAILRNVKNGVYVDVGAYHPILYSNTYAFYQKGWRGIVIDPNIAMKVLYRVFRRKDIFVYAGVGSKYSKQKYYSFSDGAYNTFNERTSDECKKKKQLTFLGVSQVEMIPLSEIVAKYGLSRIDFLNIDVEGMDLQVLKSYDWNIRPRVIAIEDHMFNPTEPMQSPVYRFLFEHNYMLSGVTAYTLIFQSK